MATRAESISEVRNILDEPFQGAPSLHRIVGTFLRFEGQLILRLNNSGVPWAVKSFTLVSDPATDTYTLQTGSPAAAIPDFGKPLFVVKATGNTVTPYVAVPFDDLREQSYGILYQTGSDVTPWILSPTIEKLSFYREGAIDPVNKVKINPVPQTAQTYTISYAVGNVGRADALTSAYAIPELASWVELHTAMALLPYCKWSEDVDANTNQKKELATAFAYQMDTVDRTTDIYIRDIVHPRVTEVLVSY